MSKEKAKKENAGNESANTKKVTRKKKEQTHPKYSALSSLAWAMGRMWKLDPRFVLIAFLAVPEMVATPLVQSWFSKVLIDGIGAGKEFAGLAVIVCQFTFAILLLELYQRFMWCRFGARLYYPTVVYQTEMSDFKEMKTDYENTEKQDFKEIDGYAWRDSCNGNAAVELFLQNMQSLCTNLLGIVTYVSVLAMVNPVIFIVAIITAVLSYFTSRWRPVYYEKHKHKWEKEARKRDYLSRLSENFGAAKDIKLYGLEEWIDGMMRGYQAFILGWNKRCSLRSMLASFLEGLMTLIQNTAAYLILIGLLLKGQITVGEFVFYFGLVGGISRFLQNVILDVADLHTQADKIGYYREYFAYPNRLNHGEGEALPKAPVAIELRDVWYRYDGAEDDTLKGITLTLKAGESLALVGLNGAGKTTLVKLLCGLYMPTKGEIFVGGKRIEEYNIEEYYTMISAVFQKIQTVAFTCFEFVASADLNRETARQDAKDAMKKAGIWEKISGLENGMDTHLQKGIYEDGVDLSGGELQKLVLARAIYKNGAILLLDEPTAALDPIAENQLYLQYRELTKGKTSVYISHRFASTRFCDRIVLLGDGVIKESGTHDELMKLGGEYAHMFEVQSKYYAEGKEEESYA